MQKFEIVCSGYKLDEVPLSWFVIFPSEHIRRCSACSCRSGYKNIACVCTKIQTYKRSRYKRKSTPRICPPGEQKESGLCYKPCKSGYTGVGVVCTCMFDSCELFCSQSQMFLSKNQEYKTCWNFLQKIFHQIFGLVLCFF